MSELAFNANGDSFEVPATVTGWRVRRMKPRGAPELVYGKDGRPLTVGIEADIDELREAVGSAGRYRLDPINDDGKCVENVPAAYVQVVKPQRNADPTMAVVTTTGPSDDTLREAMRLNTELAKSVIDRFPEMMTAAAELLRAADGAGLPARQPRALDDEDETDDDDEHPEPKPGFDLNAFVAQIIPMIVMSLGNGKMPQLAEVLDWRKAAPTTKPKATKATKPARPEGPGDAPPASVPENATDVLPPIDPQTMAHFVAVQSQLTPEEGAIAREVAKELSAAELRAWFDELSKLSVPDAVAKVRKLVSGFGKEGDAS